MQPRPHASVSPRLSSGSGAGWLGGGGAKLPSPMLAPLDVEPAPPLELALPSASDGVVGASRQRRSAHLLTTDNAGHAAAATAAVAAPELAEVGVLEKTSSRRRKRTASVTEEDTVPRGGAAVVAPTPSFSVAAAVASHFSAVELYFQLTADRGRWSLLPRDVADVLLWATPSPIPLIESPRFLFMKNKSKVSDVLVIHVDGWTYDMMMCTGAGLAREKPTVDEEQNPGSAAGAPSAAPPMAPVHTPGEVWSEQLCSSLLRPLREQRCWARDGGGVQFAPVVVPNHAQSLPSQLFWRTAEPPSRSRRPESSSSRAEIVAESPANTAAPMPSGDGSGDAFRHALGLREGGNKPSDGSPAHTASTEPVEPRTVADAALTAKSEAARAAATKLWNNRELLVKYALLLDRDRAMMEELGFLVVPPSGETEAGAWERFESRGPTDVPERHGKSKAPPPTVLAFDCEMVQVANQVSVLARATLVDVRTGDVVVDMLVKPEEEIVDYVTRFSGIDETMLRDVTATLRDCQKVLKQHIDAETFVVGHSLENDFRVCKMIPTCRVLDTAYLFPHPSGLPYKNALRFLTMRYLNKKIQQGAHDSTVDALVSAELVLLKLERGPNFGMRQRKNIVDLMIEGLQASEGTRAGPSTSASPSSAAPQAVAVVHLFDDATVLKDIAPLSASKRTSNVSKRSSSGEAVRSLPQSVVHTIPVRNDYDAVRKAVRTLRDTAAKRRVGAASENVVAAGATAAPVQEFHLSWVQLSSHDVDVTVLPPVGSAVMPDGSDGDSDTPMDPARAAWETQVTAIHKTNRCVLQLIEAAADGCVVVVLAGACRSDSRINNTFSRAHGICFAMVKDSSAAAPVAGWDDDVPASIRSHHGRDREGKRLRVDVGTPEECRTHQSCVGADGDAECLPPACAAQ